MSCICNKCNNCWYQRSRFVWFFDSKRRQLSGDFKVQ